MSFQSFFFFFFFFDVFRSSFGLNNDGVLLMSFKFSVTNDPLSVLSNWNVGDETPCLWRGVSCGGDLRVIGVELPNCQLVGSLPAGLGMIQYLRKIDLSNNSINGSIPLTLFGASLLQSVDFSNNMISGELPESIGHLTSLRSLNLSGNALSGALPGNLTRLRNLTVLYLKDNYLLGLLPGGFDSVQELDLSSNLLNGSLQSNFGGSNLKYLNISSNRFYGEIPPEFSSKIPSNANLDLSFNNFSGEIPDSSVFLNQDPKAFSGNPKLCGVPLENLCHSSEPTSPPAIAAIPKTIESNPASSDSGASHSSRNRLKTGTIIAIVAGDIAAVAVIALIFIYVYRVKRRKNEIRKETESEMEFDWASSSASPTTEYNWLRSWTCLKKQRHAEAGEETSEITNSDSEESEESQKLQQSQAHTEQKTGELVTLNGEKELELETLLKASAYILGASGSSIMYKAVLEDGSALAVRRIGETGLERFREFESQVRVIAKLNHPNLIRIRGFYWGVDEKLVIYDFVPNGSLANARYRKAGCSPCHLTWGVRLKIAKGVARGLSYIHEKRHVHGNLKPSNILLGPDNEPKIGDFGLERLITGESSHKVYGSARNFGSKRSTTSRESLQDFGSGPTPSPSPSAFAISPYHAPESLRSLKPNPKWDVFSFGVVLLEFLTGKVIVSDEMGLGTLAGIAKLDDEEKSRVLKMADVTIRAEMDGKEEVFLTLLKLGYSCISPVPQKRPSMKEVVQTLDKFPTSYSFSSSPSYYL